MKKKPPLKSRRRIVAVTCALKASPATVYRALSQASEWRDWLCREAEFEPKARAGWKAGWEGGYEAHGAFTLVEPNSRIAFTWEDAEQPARTKVQLTVKPSGEGAEVALTHSGYATGARWKKAYDRSTRAWQSSLENLQSVLETGIDLRIARRPMLGVNFDVLSAEEAEAFGIAPGHLKLTGVVSGLGAEKAGLARGDVILGIGGMMLESPEAISPVLGRFKAGDEVEVSFLRDGKKRSLSLALSPRETPEVPGDPRSVVASAREAYAPFWQDMEKLLAGLTEEEASKPEGQGRWSVKEVLAHLSAAERDNQQSMAWEIMGESPVIKGNPTVVPERLKAAMTIAPTAAELLARYRKDVEESLEMILALRPEFLLRKLRYRRVALGIAEYLEHAKGHLGQIQRILRAVVGD